MTSGPILFVVEVRFRLLKPKRFSTKMCLTVRLIDLVCCICRSEQLLWFDVVEHNDKSPIIHTPAGPDFNPRSALVTTSQTPQDPR